jgi:hypothetical protein
MAPLQKWKAILNPLYLQLLCSKSNNQKQRLNPYFRISFI